MTTNHIDQLAQWYADAEQVTKTNLPRKGDTLIYPRRTSGYIIESDGGGWAPEFVHSAGEAVRILARAPEPKPAWVNAAYVLAYAPADVSDFGELRKVYYRRADGRYVDWNAKVSWGRADLRDVTPLIEAKVTNEMVERAKRKFEHLNSEMLYVKSDWAFEKVLTAALGLETE